MGIYIEALILYIILFLANSVGAIGRIPEEVVDFSVSAELYKITLYSIPSLVLVWYLLSRGKVIKNYGLKLRKTDLLSFLIALPCLLLTGFLTAYVSRYISASSIQSWAVPQTSFLSWAILSLSCIITAYFEESFFRYYLISKRKELNMGPIPAIFFSTLLFSVCHIYEGPWGFLNSVISGGILAFLFLRYQTLHGIAIAHGVYNIAVYIINSILAYSL